MAKEIVRKEPDKKYLGQPCSVTCVGTAYDHIHTWPFTIIKPEGMRYDGYLRLRDMNQFAREYLPIAKRIDFKKHERPRLKEFLQTNETRCCICVLGHYLYVEQAKKDYFKYMTWYLATPFMAYLRYFASRNNYDTKLFPLFGVMYGDSNGGKTTFIKFLVKLMCNETVKMNTTEDFTATKIDGLKRVCEGLPINIDDLAKTQFQSHSERIIKNDGWGVSERLINYPAVSITSNKITSLTKDLSKRAIICRIGAKIDNERGAKNSKRVNESMSELTTAFYGEYVRRMLVCIDEMTTEMRENANGKEYFPDIFYASSSVIADIFRACKIDLPVYAHILSYDDYMGDKSIGRAAIEKIELAWQADPNKFRVDKKKNRLIYSYPQDGPWYELKYIADELPNSLEAEISGGNQLVMNYEQAQELFGIKFQRWLGIFNL